MNFVATQILPRSVEYATRDVIWEPIVELQNLLQGHYYGHPVYKYDTEHYPSRNESSANFCSCMTNPDVDICQLL